MPSGLFAIPTDASSCAVALPGDRALPKSRSRRFVAGPENTLVAQAVAAVRHPAPQANPLVLAGPSGTGKSLLLELLIEEFRGRFQDVATQSVTATDFARAYAHAVQTDSIGEFRQRFSRLHLLAIDDLDRLWDKPAAQQELEHLIDSMLRRGCLVLATCRTHPLDAPSLSYPLASRLSAGLVIPISLPTQEARQALIEHFAAELNVPLPAAATARLAEGAASRADLATAPQLRRAVMGVGELARSHSAEITPDLVERYLRSFRAAARMPLKAVAAAVSKHFDVPVAQMRGKSRLQTVASARSLAMHLARLLTGSTYGEIGRYFGNRDHTTVMYACKKTAAAVARDARLKQVVEQLTAQLAAQEPLS